MISIQKIQPFYTEAPLALCVPIRCVLVDLIALPLSLPGLQSRSQSRPASVSQSEILMHVYFVTRDADAEPGQFWSAPAPAREVFRDAQDKLSGRRADFSTIRYPTG